MSTIAASAPTQTLRIRNTSGQAQELWIEPLGDRVVLEPGILYELTATNALEEVDFAVDGFTVYGWVVRVSAVDDDGGIRTVWAIPTEVGSHSPS